MFRDEVICISEKLISLREAAELVGITRYALRKAIKDGFVSFTCFDDAKNSKMWFNPTKLTAEIVEMSFKNNPPYDVSFADEDEAPSSTQLRNDLFDNLRGKDDNALYVGCPGHAKDACETCVNAFECEQQQERDKQRGVRL